MYFRLFVLNHIQNHEVQLWSHIVNIMKCSLHFWSSLTNAVLTGKKYQELKHWGWKYCLMVKSTHSYCEGPAVCVSHADWVTHNPHHNPSPGDVNPFPSVLVPLFLCTHTYIYTYTYIYILKPNNKYFEEWKLKWKHCTRVFIFTNKA